MNMGPRRKHLEDNVTYTKTLLSDEEERQLPLDDQIEHLDSQHIRLQKHLETYKDLINQLEDDILASKDDEKWRRWCDEKDEKGIHDLLLDAVEQSSLLQGRLNMKKLHLSRTIEQGARRVEDSDKDKEIKELKDKMDAQAEKMAMLSAKLEGEVTKKGAKEAEEVRIPKLDIASFSGNLLDWEPFWQAFSSTIGESKKAPVVKFNHLVSKLEGDAKKVIGGLAITNDNYAVAVGLLKSRFQKKSATISAHYRKIREMPKSSASACALRVTYDTLESHLRSIETLGDNPDHYRTMDDILSKFPVTVSEEIWKAKKDKDSPMKLDEFRAAIKEYIENKECAVIHEQAGNGESSRVSSTTESLFVSRSKQKPVCCFCSKNHHSGTCTKYPTVEARKEQAKIRKLCLRCLAASHQTGCYTKLTCFHCHKQHHSAFCYKKHGPPSNTKKKETAITGLAACAGLEDKSYIFLQSAEVKASSMDDKFQKTVYIILDSGSQKSYITERVSKDLHLRKNSYEHLSILHFGSRKPKKVKSAKTTLKLLTLEGQHLEIEANIVPALSGKFNKMPPPKCDAKTLGKYTLADNYKEGDQNQSIDILLGSDYYPDILKQGQKKLKSGLHLINTVFGYVVTGKVKDTTYSHDQGVTPSLFVYNPMDSDIYPSVLPCETKSGDHEPTLSDLYKLETIGIMDTNVTKKDDDTRAMENFKKNVRYIQEEQRYEIAWPWKDDTPVLYNNYGQALGRLTSTYNSLQKQPELLDKYDSILRMQLERGMIEIVEDPEEIKDSKSVIFAKEKMNDEVDDDSKWIIHYLSHFPVIKPERLTTPIRICFDASAKVNSRSKSLNDLLFKGPTMVEDLTGILMRTQMKPIMLLSDLEKAFMMISVRPDQRDCTRFLWVKSTKKPLTKENIQVLKFKRVLFGVISSPFLLGAVIKHHLEKSGSEIAQQLSDDLYVDNIITTVDGVIGARDIYKEAKNCSINVQ